MAFLVGRALDRIGMESGGSTAIVQGFGNVGSVSAYTLGRARRAHRRRQRPHRGLLRPEGHRHPGTCSAIVAAARPAARLLEGEPPSTRSNCWCSAATSSIPAAVERVITADNAGKLKCRILAEGANGPTTPEADAVLDQRRDEIFVLPDILCNAGGVVVSYFEWVQDLQRLFWEEAEVFDRLYRILDRSFQRMMERAKRDNVSHRMAAMAIGVATVASAKQDARAVSLVVRRSLAACGAAEPDVGWS